MVFESVMSNCIVSFWFMSALIPVADTKLSFSRVMNPLIYSVIQRKIFGSVTVPHFHHVVGFPMEHHINYLFGMIKVFVEQPKNKVVAYNANN